MLEAYQHTQSSEHCFLTLASPAPSFLLDRSDLRLTCYFYLPVPRIKPRSLAPVRQAPYRCPVSPYLFLCVCLLISLTLKTVSHHIFLADLKLGILLYHALQWLKLGACSSTRPSHCLYLSEGAHASSPDHRKYVVSIPLSSTLLSM